MKTNEFVLLQTLSHLFQLIQFVECQKICLQLNSERLYQSSGKEKESYCLEFTSQALSPCSHTATAKKCTMYMFSHPDCCCLRCCLSSLILLGNYLTRVTQTKLTNNYWITGKQQYIPRKLVRDQSRGRKKNNKLFKASNLNIDSKQFSRKQNVSPDNVFLFETFHITPRRHICLRHAVILSSTSNFLCAISSAWQ